jgi:hypothetical protein
MCLDPDGIACVDWVPRYSSWLRFAEMPDDVLHSSTQLPELTFADYYARKLGPQTIFLTVSPSDPGPFLLHTSTTNVLHIPSSTSNSRSCQEKKRGTVTASAVGAQQC